MGRNAAIIAVHIFFHRGNEVLLARRFNTGYEDGNYSVPSGHVEAKEEVIHAAVREAQEEVGVCIDPRDLQFVHCMQRIKLQESDRVDFFFDIWEWKGSIENREPEKCDRLQWTSLDDLPQNTVRYIQIALSHCRAGVSFSQIHDG